MTRISSALKKIEKATLTASLVETILTGAPMVVAEYVTAVATACYCSAMRSISASGPRSPT